MTIIKKTGENTLTNLHNIFVIGTLKERERNFGVYENKLKFI